MLKDTQIRGSLAVSHAATIGGSVNIRGSVNIAGNVNVGGWLDAPNIKTPCKGLFADIDTLTRAYPKPQPGWWALVGNALPARIYRSEGHHWADTGEDGGDASVDLSLYDRQLDQLREAINDIESAPVAATATTAHPVEVRDTDEADLILADAEGTVIATFEGGHIRTANFDSANITGTTTAAPAGEDTANPYEGLRFSIIGDSISTYSGTMPSGYATYYPQGDITSQSHTWWAKVAKALGMTLLSNCSWSGSGVTGQSANTASAGVGTSDRRIADLADGDTHPDVIFIWIGINDWGGGTPTGDYDSHTPIPTGLISQFAPAYAAAVTKAMAAYPAAKICCCTLPEVKGPYSDPGADFPRVNSASATVADYNAAIAAVCHATGATLIDLHGCGITHWNATANTIDGLHPNARGATLAADKIISTLLYNR